MRTSSNLAAALTVLVIAGCGDSPDATPAPRIGHDACAVCGMTVDDARFAAAARTASGTVLAYDAIECLVRDLRRRSGEEAPAETWLPDLPTGGLHPADVMTVVLADYPSPMGGGYAAFRDAAAAEAAAARRGGVAGALAEFVAGTRQRPGP